MRKRLNRGGVGRHRKSVSLKRSQVRRAAAVVESLEQRQLLTVAVTATPDLTKIFASPQIHLSASPNDGATPTGILPNQMRGAYGLGPIGSSNVMFGNIQGDGAGQTIAITDAYNDPGAVADLAAFSAQFGLPAMNTAGNPTFKILNQDGNASPLPGTDPIGAGNFGWAFEESLDIEWAHVIAPKANIVLLESNDNSDASLGQADQTAATLPGVTVVSNSWGEDEFDGDSALTSTYNATGVTYLYSTGDSGAFSYQTATIAPGFPASSPNVVAVGGTNLTVNDDNTYGGETAWGNGPDSGFIGGGGGGISQFQSQPAFQKGVVDAFSTTQRTIPDVSMDGGPDGAVPVLDSFDLGSGVWTEAYGTSLSCPMWAGLVSIVNQGRSIEGLAPLTGATQTLPLIYSLPGSDFHDITTGNNGYAAGPGYDLATGIGSPLANKVIADMVADADLSVTIGSPASPVTAGDPAGFDYTLTVTNNGPSIDLNGFTVTQTLPAGVVLQSATAGDVVSGQNVTYTSTSTLAASQSVSYTLHVTVPSSTPGNTTLSSTATVAIGAGMTSDTNAANNHFTATTSVGATADVSITKTSLANAVVGQNLTYVIVVSNAGPSEADGVTVIDTLPVGLSNITYTASQTGGASGFVANGSGNLSNTDNLPTGSTVTYLVTGTVNTTAAGTISNTATVADPSNETDPHTANNSATWVTNIVSSAVEADPFGPGTALFIGNGSGRQYIDVNNVPQSKQIQVSIGTNPRPTSNPTQLFSSVSLDRIVLYASGGNDSIHIEKTVTIPSMVFASGGHNLIQASDSGNDVLVAGGGHNTVEAGSGDSIVIGGTAGADTLNGYGTGAPSASSQDLFIAGGTNYDNNLAALFALSSEWSSGSSLSTRAAHLQSGGGANGTYVLNSMTITRAAAADSIAMQSLNNMVFAHVTGSSPHDLIVALHAPVTMPL